MLRIFVLALLALCLCGCDQRQGDAVTVHGSNRVTSPSGCCEAAIVESRMSGAGSITQVFVSFPQERCGRGAVSLPGADLGLTLRWSGPETLVVEYPVNLEVTRNASGEWLQCKGQKVHVLLRPHGPNSSFKADGSAAA
jgi:hypothetical protein